MGNNKIEWVKRKSLSLQKSHFKIRCRASFLLFGIAKLFMDNFDCISAAYFTREHIITYQLVSCKNTCFHRSKLLRVLRYNLSLLVLLLV